MSLTRTKILVRFVFNIFTLEIMEKKNIFLKECMMYVFHEESIDDYAYYSRTLLLQLRVKTDDGHRVAGSGLDHSVQIKLFPLLGDKH